MPSDMESLLKNTHFRYIAIIAIFLLLSLLSIVIGDSARLFEYVNAGVAITSLTLSVFAIWMTAKSNSKNDENIGKLRETIRENTSSAIAIKDSSQEISTNVSTLSNFISTIENKIDGSNTAIQTLTETLSRRVLNVNSSDGGSVVDSVVGLGKRKSEEEIEYFLQSCSITGLIVLTIAIRLSAKNVAFLPSELTDFDNRFDRNYVMGFMVAMISARILDPRDRNFLSGVYNNVNEINIEKIYEKIINHENGDDEKLGMKDFVSERLKNADLFVASKIKDNGLD